ncbi:hypothetical protein AO262_15065 [Pseudomonas fluorescens ABAC62]|nr:hypothetical protein AO262_15065 [Pseudomonas fluorescens ABAC62]
MVIGHRFERTAQGDLHIHSRNGVQSVFVLLTGAISFILPLSFVVFWFSDANGHFTGVNPLTALLVMLGMLLMPAMGLMLMVYMGMRETLLLSQATGEGKRRTRNFFGRRERVQSTFRIDKADHLELRRHPDAEPAFTQLWLVMRDGTEQRLTTDNVPVVPGSKRTERWLRELADYLDLAVPTEVIVGIKAAAAPPYKPAPSPARVARRLKAQGPAPAAEPPTETFGMPARALLGLLGAFLAVLELTNVIALVSGLFTGRLRVSGVRSGSTSFYWAEQPLVFSFNMLVGVAEVLIIGAIAWGCLRTAVLGRMKADR